MMRFGQAGDPFSGGGEQDTLPARHARIASPIARWVCRCRTGREKQRCRGR